VWTCGGDIAA